jgi:hypothetical protein
MKPAKTIEVGKTYDHSNFGSVRVIAVTPRGVLVIQTFGRDGNKQTVEHRVAKRDLYEA